MSSAIVLLILCVPTLALAGGGPVPAGTPHPADLLLDSARIPGATRSGGFPTGGPDQFGPVGSDPWNGTFLVGRVAVGSQPTDMVLDPQNGFLYVNNFGPPPKIANGNSESIINGTNDQVVATIAVGDDPLTNEFDPANGFVYVNDYGVGDNLTVINGSRTIASIPVGISPDYGVYDPGDGYLYVANGVSGNVSLIDDLSVVGSIGVGAVPISEAYDAADQCVYVANYGSADVTVINGTSVVATIGVGTNPAHIAYDPANGDVYVPDEGSGNVSVIHGTTLLANVTVSGAPYSVAYDPADARVYVPNSGLNNVDVISGLTLVENISVGVSPRYATYDASSGLVYVDNWASDSVSLLNESARVADVATGPEPWSVFYDPLNLEVYAPEYGGQGLANLNSHVSIIGSTPSPYYVTFAERGLPASENWSVLVGNTTYFSSTNRFSFSAPNGSYGYYVPRPRGYAPTFDAGAAYVNGSDPVVNISFVPTYTITFNETGLPSGMTWGGTIVPWQNSSSSNSFTLLEPNGTYHYTLNPVPGFTTLWEGTVQVAGSNTTVSVVFAATTYAVQFAESGLPVGAGWSVVIDGISKPANSSILQVLLPNGSYRFVIPSVGGFYPGPASGSVEVAGNGTTVQVQFLFTYAVTFQETGLAPGTSWTLKVGGVAHTAEASAIVLNEPNGTFGYTIDPIRGYFAAWSGSVQVAGENLSVPVPFTLVTYALQFMATGLPPGTFWSVVVDGVDHPTSGSSLLLEEPNGTYTVTYSPSGPYSLLNEPPALVQVNGGGFNVTVAYGLTFDLAFVESGLPFATAWTVSVILTGSLTQISGNSSTATISFQEPNGSYAYTPGAQPGFFTPARGTANLRGSDVTVSIVYAPYTYPVLFNQSGLPARTAWNVSIEGTTYGSTSSTLTVSLPIGVHDYLIVPLPGYRTTWTGQVTVSGRPASVNVTFTTLTYPLLIEEIGLAPGTPWGIEVGNLSVNTSSSSTTIQLANGTYAYTPSPVAGYEVPGSGSIGVEGTLGGRLVVVYSSPASSATLFDLPPAEGYAVVLGLILVSVAAIAAAAFAFRSRRPGS